MPIPTSFVQAISLCSCGPSRFQERHLQHLIAENPGLLPSDNRPEQRRWLLVTRELPITAEGTSFSLDHLFLDEDGVPTLVESKLASNPQHRREVIGQALDYASWFAFDGSEVIRRYLVARCGDAADDEVREAFGTDDEDEFDVEAYWRRVDDQLRQGRMRLLFVGDSVSPLVRRVTEFLNRELRNVDVLAVEYAVWGDDAETRVLVPTVHGLSVDKRASSGPATPARVWTEEEWLAAFEQRNGVGISNGARRLIERWRGNESAGFHVWRARVSAATRRFISTWRTLQRIGLRRSASFRQRYASRPTHSRNGTRGSASTHPWTSSRSLAPLQVLMSTPATWRGGSHSR